MENCVKNGVVFTSDSAGGSPPASSKRIFHPVISLKRFATTEPADPAPTMIKSYSSPTTQISRLLFSMKKKLCEIDQNLLIFTVFR